MGDDTIHRRKLLKGMGISAMAGLSGCLGEDVADERVPTITMEYWSGEGAGSDYAESAVPVIQENLEELGLNIEVEPVELATQLNSVFQDKRTSELPLWWHTGFGSADPDEFTRRFAADWAGGNGQGNPANWANCDYQELALEQRRILNPDEREEVVHQAHSLLSEEAIAIPVNPRLAISAINTDVITSGELGEVGLQPGLPRGFLNLESDEVIETNVSSLAETTTVGTTTLGDISMWNKLLHSPLWELDTNFELENVIANERELYEDENRVVVELADATFSNGDPITTEDVIFTFTTLAENPGAFPIAGSPPYEHIEEIDDNTIEFALEEPYAPIIDDTLQSWGIFHKQSWIDGGVEDDPANVTLDPYVGSGPYSVITFERGQYVETEVNEGNPISVPNEGYLFRTYDTSTAATDAFITGELDLITDIAPADRSRIEEQMENVEFITASSFFNYIIYPQYPSFPVRYKEFRQAVGKAIDRELTNDLGLEGESEPETHATYWTEAHPWRPPTGELYEYTSDTTGDIEDARQTLEDEGWSWDDNGNLLMPDDMDDSPLWPEGEEPNPDDYPCL